MQIDHTCRYRSRKVHLNVYFQDEDEKYRAMEKKLAAVKAQLKEIEWDLLEEKKSKSEDRKLLKRNLIKLSDVREKIEQRMEVHTEQFPVVCET